MLILQRVLTGSVNGQQVGIPVRIFLPKTDNDGTWYCHYEIGWPDELRSHQAAGADGIQSLLLAMQMIAAELYNSDLHRSGCLWWHEVGEGYGLPLPPGLRDLYEGDDKSL